MSNNKLGIIMGSDSDWRFVKLAAEELDKFSVAYESKIISAHRTPHLLPEYALYARDNNIKVIIAAAGGAAHLPGMMAAYTIIPVIGIPIPLEYYRGHDSLLSIVQMPKGVPVATMAIGESGVINAALFAIAILSQFDPILHDKLLEFRAQQTQNTLNKSILT